MKPYTKRETQIINLLIQGLLDKEIASKLGISFQTVKNLLVHMRKKTGARNRVQLAVRAVEDMK